MILVIFDLTEYIEQENAHILVKILMVQEKLRQECQIFTVYWIFIAINLENCYFAFFVPVDLITWRMEKRANLRVPFELNLECKETEAKIADVEAV